MKKKKAPLWKKLYLRWGERLGRLAAEGEGISFKRPTPVLQPAPAKAGVTAILTVYKRAGYLAKQVAALRAQTQPPAEIWLWCNDNEGAPVPDFSDIADRVVISNHNWKFFGRFALAMMVQTKYVALFDDDILPQPQWLENCLQTVANGHDGILGGIGVLLPKEGGYAPNEKVGWNAKHSTQAEVVDLVGHAWFMDKRHLRHMWREEPYSYDNGEDIHLSCMALKHGGIKTYVPPHPPDNPAMWSSDPDFGRVAGGDAVATYKQDTNHQSIRDEAVNYHRKNGWKIVND